jgi:hypothetical protein
MQKYQTRSTTLAGDSEHSKSKRMKKTENGIKVGTGLRTAIVGKASSSECPIATNAPFDLQVGEEYQTESEVYELNSEATGKATSENELFATLQVDCALKHDRI